MTTFAVDKVSVREPSKRYYGNEKWTAHYLGQELARVGLKSAEASKFNVEDGRPFLLNRPDINSFLDTCIRAYDEHIPLTFAPDDIWLVCVQAVAKHIELNPEEVRRVLVQFDGKKTLTVRDDNLVKGSSDNNWGRVFASFGDQIGEHLGKKRDLFDPTFSTTTPVEKAAIQVQMMAALAPYFEYRVMTCCGIPSITLLGTVEDWEALLSRVVAFGELLPTWAHTPMVRVTTEFLLAKKGNVNLEFWQNFVKEYGGSGGPSISGYINGFFPYLNKRPNYLLLDRNGNACFEQSMASRCDVYKGDFPGSVTTVPLTWDYYGEEIKMQLATGIMGTAVYGAGYRPVIGWAVGESREPLTEKEARDLRLKAYKEGQARAFDE